MKKGIYNLSILLAVLFLLQAAEGLCQGQDKDPKAPSYAADSASLETERILPADSLDWSNDNKDLSTTIKYTAEDSMVMDVPKKRVYLYGKATVTYGDISLKAEKISIDWENNEIRAFGKVDSNGLYRGRPLFTQGADQYQIDSMGVNMQSGKAILYNVVTEQSGGYLTGTPVKRTDEALYIKSGSYTTCNKGDPHFCIQAHKLKVIPEKQIISGPFHLVVSGVHTPIGFPLAFFPIMDKGKSGVIFPTIGENRSRGFFISRGGYYFKFKEKMGLSLIGDFYSNGSYLFTINNVYKNRYHYDGDFSLNLSRFREGFGSVSQNPYNNQFNVRWLHRTAAAGRGRFSSDVNISSSRFYTQASYDPQRVQSNTFTSAVSYSQSLRNTPFNFTISANHTQNVQTREMRVTLPNIAVNMNRIYPFRKKVGSGNSWYEKINTQATLNASYAFSNRFQDFDTGRDSVYDFNKDTYERILRNGTPGAKWSIPVSTTFNILRYFTFTPTINYSEFWYSKRLAYTYNSATGKVVADYENGFFRTYQADFNVRLNTWIYGKWNNRGNGALKGIRHSINPVVSYAFIPDYSKIGDNYQRFSQSTNANGDEILYNRYASAPYGGPSSSIQNRLTFQIINIVEGKYLRKKDTSGVATKFKILENLMFGSGYDFTRDSLKMDFVNLNARTNIYKFDINFTSIFDPYIYVADTTPTNLSGIRISKYAFAEGQGLLKLTNLNFSIGRAFKPRSAKGKSTVGDKLGNNKSAEAEYIKQNPDLYVDFNLPWQLRLDFSYNFIKTGLADRIETIGLRASGDISLTEKWKVTATSGYDFVVKNITYTTFAIVRDLHCWQASFNCIPFGNNPTYFFTFSAKSSLLQDLKLSKRSAAYIGQY